MSRPITYRIYPRTDGMWGVMICQRGWFGSNESPLGNPFAPETFSSKKEAEKRIRHMNRSSLTVTL